MIAILIKIVIVAAIAVIGYYVGYIRAHLKVTNELCSKEHQLQQVVNHNLKFLGDLVTIEYFGRRDRDWKSCVINFDIYPMYEIHRKTDAELREAITIWVEEFKKSFLNAIKATATDGSPENSYNTQKMLWEAEEIRNL